MPERVGPPTDLPLLAEMGEELHRLFLAEERQHARRPLRRRARLRQPAARRPLRVLVVLVLVLAAATAVALAAGGLLSGAPVRPPYKVRPRIFDGAPIPTSARLLALSVPDPSGGLPWGLRTLATTRGLGCLQYGRLYGGELGVLGQDGAFGDDHRFHVLSPLDAVSGEDACGPLDADGHLFLATQSQAMPASADPEACVAPVDYERGARAPLRGIRLCPAVDERALFYGALGPDVESISYSLRTRRETFEARGRARDFTVTSYVYAQGGPTATEPTTGAQGAYLIVAHALPDAPSGTFGPGAPNGSSTLPSGLFQPIREITYRDGYVCHIGATQDLDNRGRPCSPLGRVPPGTPTPAAVRSSLSARILYDHRDPPLKPEDLVQVSFIARAPIASAANLYEVAMRDPCRGGSSASSTDEDIAAGRRVTLELSMSLGPSGSKPCPGVYSGEVLYAGRSTDRPFQASGLVVGRFAVRLR
jgi:hypothetical protein